jgi:hypothetical protein
VCAISIKFPINLMCSFLVTVAIEEMSPVGGTSTTQ